MYNLKRIESTEVKIAKNVLIKLKIILRIIY